MIRIIATIVMVISMVMFAIMADDHQNVSKGHKSTCSTCRSHAKETQDKEMTEMMLSKVVFEKLMDGMMINVDLSNGKSVVVFLNKETIRDYNQVSNFEKWIEQKKLDIKVYTVINGQDKEETKKLAKENKIMQALWDIVNLGKRLKVEKYPMAYYVVNGQVINQTDKLNVGNLKQMVYCEKCQKVKITRSSECCKNNENEKEMKDRKEVKNKCTKEGCCGGNCNCSSKCKCSN